jgi:hypothetical protein
MFRTIFFYPIACKKKYCNGKTWIKLPFYFISRIYLFEYIGDAPVVSRNQRMGAVYISARRSPGGGCRAASAALHPNCDDKEESGRLPDQTNIIYWDQHKTAHTHTHILLSAARLARRHTYVMLSPYTC